MKAPPTPTPAGRFDASSTSKSGRSVCAAVSSCIAGKWHPSGRERASPCAAGSTFEIGPWLLRRGLPAGPQLGSETAHPSRKIPESPEREETALDELSVAQSYLNGRHGAPRDSSEAVRWLWRSVAKQNASATLLLSDFYLRGDGVSKSCDQARLLLDAAARKGKAAARVSDFATCRPSVASDGETGSPRIQDPAGPRPAAALSPLKMLMPRTPPDSYGIHTKGRVQPGSRDRACRRSRVNNFSPRVR